MKALLYKDFLVLWKQMKFVIFMVAIFCLLPNLGFGLNNMWVVYAGLVIPTSLLAYDERAKWDELAAMMPYTVKSIVGSKYVLGLLLLTILPRIPALRGRLTLRA